MRQSGWNVLGCALSWVLASGLIAADPAAAKETSSVDANASVYLDQTTGEYHGSGAIRPDARQWAWGETNLMTVRSVHLNQRGLDRVNQARKARGTLRGTGAALQAVPMGREASSEPDPAPLTTAADLPCSVDNSTLKYFPPIRNQGTLGSCAQFAAVYYALTYMTAMARDWDAKNGGDQFRFSPKWTYNMLNGGQNIGTWDYDAYAIAQKHGAATWAEFPYDTDYRGWCLDPAAWRSALGVRADQAGRVTDMGTDDGLYQLKQLLVNGYVLNFATYAGSWRWQTIGNDPTPRADNTFAGRSAVVQVNGLSVGHVLTIVGYNDDIWVDLNGDRAVTPDEKGALLIANSWGTNWNDNGFCWISYAALRTRNPAYPYEGLFWFDEATWITARPAYAPQLVAEFTVNHRDRDQLQMSLGVSSTTETEPAITWQPAFVLSYAGGPWAFDGSTNAIDGTFCLDLTDLVPPIAGKMRYYVSMSDQTAGNPATLKSCQLLVETHYREMPYDVLAVTVDAAQTSVALDCDVYAAPPQAVAIVSPADGTCPLPVSLDGSVSIASDNPIAAYTWDLGDGTVVAGQTSQHTYRRPGSYQVTLTVSDTEGISSTTTATVTSMDLCAYRAAQGVVVDYLSVNETGTNDIVISLFRDNQWVEVGRQSAIGNGSNLYRFLVPGLAAGESYTLEVQDDCGVTHPLGSVRVGDFSLQAAPITNSVLTLNWESIPRTIYEVQHADTLAGPWTAVSRVTAETERSVFDARIESTRTTGFFKVVHVDE